jgi:hypothetical protein
MIRKLEVAKKPTKNELYIDMRRAMADYGSWHSRDVNMRLRANPNYKIPDQSANPDDYDTRDDIDRLIQRLDAAYAAGNVLPKAKKKIWVYRGLYGFNSPLGKLVHVQKKRAVGKIIFEPGYSSFSQSEEVARSAMSGDGVIMEVRLLPGTPVFPGRGDEAEYVLNRGSKFKIKSVEQDEGERDFDYTVYRVVCELVPPKKI